MPSGTPTRLTHRKWALDGELCIHRAGDLMTQMLQELRESADLAVDLSGVVGIDTAGLQVLIALKRRAIQMERALHLVNHSPVVLEAITLLGLAAFFGDPLIESMHA
ncbi:MAG TPA: STAS domain-containing protein [Burkholderiaceae bacterium]|nr:STAS domain-containing protein [Burkholderiaceae bacterium]